MYDSRATCSAIIIVVPTPRFTHLVSPPRGESTRGGSTLTDSAHRGVMRVQGGELKVRHDAIARCRSQRRAWLGAPWMAKPVGWRLSPWALAWGGARAATLTVADARPSPTGGSVVAWPTEHSRDLVTRRGSSDTGQGW